MTLLPVVERELRVASRQAGTYRVRFLAAFITLLFSVFSLWMVRAFFNERPIPPRDLFLALTWMEFAFVIIAGFSLTCDSICQEKRDATLGLLFLTDLKGYDIVLGKLSVAAARGVYALLATVPVLALPLMMGGTNLTELALTALTLLVTLFFSIGVGLAVSSVLRRNWTAFGLSAFILLLFALILPVYSVLLRSYYGNVFLAHLIELPSPSYALLMSFRSAMGLRGNNLALSLGLIVTAALLAIVAAALVTPHVWKDRPPARWLASVLERLRKWKFGANEARDKFRRRLLNLNPIYWLSRRERVSSLGLMLLIFFAGVLASGFAAHDWSPRGGWQANVIAPFLAWTICAGVAHLMILLRVPVLAAERFGEDRRSGALELILSTPLSVKAVLGGHWMALRRYFTGPALLAMGLQVLVLFQALNLQALNPNTRVRSLGEMLREVWQHLFYAPIGSAGTEFNIGILLLLVLFPMLLLNWIALAWVSTWLSIRVKNALTAPLATLVLAHLPPFFAQWIIALSLDDWHLLPRGEFSQALLFLAIGIATVLAHHILLIRWARRNLYAHFRTAATDRYEPERARNSWWWKLFRLLLPWVRI